MDIVRHPEQHRKEIAFETEDVIVISDKYPKASVPFELQAFPCVAVFLFLTITHTHARTSRSLSLSPSFVLSVLSSLTRASVPSAIPGPIPLPRHASSGHSGHLLIDKA